MQIELTKRLFWASTRMEIDAISDTMKEITGRDWPVHGPHTDNDESQRFSTTMDPLVVPPTGADLEVFLQNAFEQNAQMHAECADDGEIDTREAKCEALGEQYGFKIRLPLAGVAFKVTIEEIPL